MIVKAGDTDVTTYFVMRLAADGTAATGLTITNFDLQYVRSGAACAEKVDATELASPGSAHADNKAIEADDTDQPGLYRVDWPDAAFAVGVREVVLTVKCATCFTEHLRVELSPPVDTVAISGGTTEADRLQAALGAGSYIAADVQLILGHQLTQSGTQVADGFEHFFDHATPAVTVGDAMRGTNSAALASVCTEARLAALTDWIDGGRLDLLLDAIPTTAMRGTDNANTTKSGYTLTNLPDATTALFAAMFGGAGTPLKLTKLIVEANDATAAVDIDNAGAGAAIKVTSDSGDALLLQSVSGADLKLDGGGMIETTAGADVIELGVDKALENAIPGSPTAESINQRIKAIDVLTEASGDGDLAAILDDTGTSGVVLASGEDVYHADIEVTVDAANSKDEYTVTWFKNGVRITSGITVPKIQVVKRVDGTDLIAQTAMSEIGTTESFKYDETTNRLTAGEAALAIATATIDAATRTFVRVVSRDSSS